jgi:pimeloyl-ACP methyl ester carboxylesterase
MPTALVNNVPLYYESAGSGPPLLFLHGLGSSSQDWELQAPAFGDDYRVITVDLRGHGRSAKPAGPYSIPLFAADVAALLRELDAAPAHVVGISMGGMITLQLAVDAAPLLRSIVVVNSGADLVPRSLRDRWVLWERLLLARALGPGAIGRRLAPRLFPKPDQAPLRAAFAARWSQNDPRAYLAALRGLVGWSVADSLAQISTPALFIAADQDYTPLAVKEWAVAQLPNARLAVVADSRHATPVEHPALFNKLVGQFLKEQA